MVGSAVGSTFVGMAITLVVTLSLMAIIAIYMKGPDD